MASKGKGSAAGHLPSEGGRSFWYYFVYSLIGATITPLLLKTLDNKVFEEISKPFSSHYLLASYVMLISLFASPLLKKLAATTFGEDIFKSVDAVAKVAPEIVKNSIEADLGPDKEKQVIDMHGLLSAISSGKISKVTDALQYSEVIDLAKKKRLIKILPNGGIEMTSLGGFYNSGGS